MLILGNALNSFATIMQAWKKKCANHPSSFDMKESDEIAGIPTTAHSRVKSGAAMKNIAPKETQVLKMITLSMIVFVGMNVFMLLKSTYVAFL